MSESDKNLSKFRSMVLDNVAEDAYANAAAKGFHDGESAPGPNSVDLPRIGVFVANLHGEASEFWEAARKGKLHQPCDKPCGLTCAEEELADIVIRAFDTAHALGISIGQAVTAKMAYNQTRERMHGGELA